MAFEFAANNTNDMLMHWLIRHPITVNSHAKTLNHVANAHTCYLVS